MGSHSAAHFFVHLFQRAKVFPCDALGGICNFFRRTAGNDASALFSAARAPVDDVIGIPYDVKFMLDDNERRAVVDKCAEYRKECPYIERMEADGRFIKNENRIFLGAPHFACQLEPLRFPTGKSRRFFSQCQVPEAQFPQNLESSFDEFHVLAESERMIHIHVHQFRKGYCFSLFIHKTDAFCVLPIARAMAGRAGNLHIRQELYIQADDACPVTDWTSEFSRIVREISCFESLFPGTFAPGVDFSQLIMDIRISRNRRSYIDANRRRIDKFDISLCRKDR